ncbi:hypothetical protein [Enterobacter hormaechei]
MTKALTQKEKVAVFVRYKPNCAVGDVSEAAGLGWRHSRQIAA